MKTLLLLFSFFMLSTLADFSYVHADDKESLTDVTGVAVIIDEISPTARKDDLNEKYIKEFTEDILNRANIILYKEDKWFQKFGGAFLLIQIIASKAESGEFYAIFVDVELHQTVVLFGKKLGKNITTTASTWSIGKLLSCEVENLKPCVAKSLGELVGLFIKDYKEVKYKIPVDPN